MPYNHSDGCAPHQLLVCSLAIIAAKLHRVSSSLASVGASALRMEDHRIHVGDRPAVVQPFMRDVNETSRNFATLGLQPPFAFAFGQAADSIHSVYTLQGPVFLGNSRCRGAEFLQHG
jgi:hypothetical protein